MPIHYIKSFFVKQVIMLMDQRNNYNLKHYQKQNPLTITAIMYYILYNVCIISNYQKKKQSHRGNISDMPKMYYVKKKNYNQQRIFYIK